MRYTSRPNFVEHSTAKAVECFHFSELSEIALQIRDEVVDKRQHKSGLRPDLQQLFEAVRLAGTGARDDNL